MDRGGLKFRGGSLLHSWYRLVSKKGTIRGRKMVSVEEGDGLAVSDDDYESDFPIIGDLLESLTPWRTGDLGCVSIRREGDFSVNEEETGMTEDPRR